jgi:hypothetical protein
MREASLRRLHGWWALLWERALRSSQTNRGSCRSGAASEWARGTRCHVQGDDRRSRLGLCKSKLSGKAGGGCVCSRSLRLYTDHASLHGLSYGRSKQVSHLYSLALLSYHVLSRVTTWWTRLHLRTLLQDQAISIKGTGQLWLQHLNEYPSSNHNISHEGLLNRMCNTSLQEDFHANIPRSYIHYEVLVY